MTTKKAFIQTYGCQMNEHDTFKMMGLLVAEGYAMTTEPDEADLVLVNTCSVRENPENKVYSFLGRLRKMKEQNADLVVGVSGCVAQQEGESILRRERLVDMVFGPDNIFQLPEMIASVNAGERVLATKWMPNHNRVQNFIPEAWVENGHIEGCKAYISITKGCDNFCTFCVVPYTRGREVSRDPENILREAENLISRGAKEIWLLGQNVNSYNAAGFGFRQLLDALSSIDGKFRIRFTSPHPNDWTNELSDLMAERPKIANQLHLPFQAGSDRVLRAMRRGHTIAEYLEKIRHMRSINPALELSTDLIVGFPTETDAEFEQTLRVVEEVRFAQIFPFKYSPRPKTRAAATMPDDVPRDVKEARLQRIIETQERITAEDAGRYAGSRQEVLIDGAHPRKRNTLSGRTDSFRPVSIEAQDLEIGDFVEVDIREASGHWLYGDVVETAAATI